MEQGAFAAVGLADKGDTQPAAAAVVRTGDRDFGWSNWLLANERPRSCGDDAPGV